MQSASWKWEVYCEIHLSRAYYEIYLFYQVGIKFQIKKKNIALTEAVHTVD